MLPFNADANQLSLSRLVGIPIKYIELAIRELFKYKKFLLLYFCIIVFLSMLVSFVSVQLYYDGWREVSGWYFRGCVYIVEAIVDIFILQLILSHYRRVTLSKLTISLCIVWSFSFILVSYLASLSLIPLDNYLYQSIDSGHSFYVYDVHRILAEIVTAIIMIWVGYYPILVLLNVRTPFKENLEIIRKYGSSLAISWVLVWSTISAINNITRIYLHQFLMEHRSDLNPSLFGYIGNMRQFMVGGLLILLPPAVTVVAFLREIGQDGFSDPPKILPLVKKDKISAE